MLSERKWNEDQLAAVTSFGGNILVSAAAGSGKTTVLVERVIRMLTDEQNPVEANRLLIVTFTRLAAAEMKARINKALFELAAQNPGDSRLGRQMLLMERAHIGTIDSFCSDVVKEYSGVLGLPAESAVADEDENKDIAAAALEEVIEEYYAGGSKDFAELAENLGGGRSDSGLGKAVLEVYNFISSMPHYGDWLCKKAKMYETEEPAAETVWGKILFEHAKEVLEHESKKAKALAQKCAEENEDKLCELANADWVTLEGLCSILYTGRWNSFRAALFEAAFGTMPRKCTADEYFKENFQNVRKEYKEAIKKLREDFAVSEEEFAEDIKAQAPAVKCLFALTLDFTKRFGELKREKRLLDYTDLEQMTLELLTEKDEDGNYVQSKIAKEIASRFDHILVDECQDTNEVQNTILQTVSKGDNLFFVGDVKQSIYRFRQAMPELFLEKRDKWPLLKETGNYPATIILGKNYRSRKNIAGAVNFIFRQIMTREAAEIEYNREEELIPEAQFPEDGLCRNELLLVEGGDNTLKREAAAVADRIYNMVLKGDTVFEEGKLRPLQYSDICILLRSPKGKIEAFLSALRAKGISCRSEKDAGFISRPEIAAVLDVLKAVDNPLLDIPLAGAMLSEMFLFTPDELAEIRAETKKMPLYNSVKLAAESGNEKAANFIAVLDTLRKAAAYERSDAVIERLYDLTAFPQVMQAAPGGELRLANLRLLMKYAADREKNGAKGLSSFIRFITRLEEREGDLKPAGSTGAGGNCVRIMSVHGSKGLEFPVVFLCGTAKKFRTDRSDSIMLHPKYGVAFQRRIAETEAKFETAMQFALKHELRKYNLAEEMRILYVALTRAKERLVISYCEKNIFKKIGALATSVTGAAQKIDTAVINAAKCEGDWILTALLRHPDSWKLNLFAERLEERTLKDDTEWNFNFAEEADEGNCTVTAAEEKAQPDERICEILQQRKNWKYPFAAAEKIPSKAGVSALTHGEMHKKLLFEAKPTYGALSGAEHGTALHTFMQFCDFDLAKADPKKEIARLLEKRFITEKQAKVISPERIKAFFESELYARIKNADKVWRELRFLRALPAAELGYEEAAPEDKITVQGVADCVFEENGKLVVVDYKTDFVENIEELAERYAPQLYMYKRLLSEALGKPTEEAVIWSFKFGKELEV